MRTWTRIAGITLAAASATTAVVGAAFVYIGIYDVGAVSQHTRPVYTLLDTAMRRSVKLRAADIPVPPLDDAERRASGFRHYRAHCAQCHGAPGVAPHPFALGMTPAPAALVATAREWPAADIFWVIRHGIKMSGMPAWQYRMSDDEIWDVVAFMKVLPTLSPAEYVQWDRLHAPQQVQPIEVSGAVPVQDAGAGNAAAGRQALQQYLCATCHVIGGVPGATRHVGPPLDGIADRQYIAGVLPNTPANLAHWIRSPTEIDPLSAMPDLGVTEQDARDIAAFLYTLDNKQ